MLKKFIAFLVLSLFIFSPSVINATEVSPALSDINKEMTPTITPDSAENNTTSINEYELIMEARKGNASNLLNKGFSKEKIEELKNISDEDIFNNLKEHSELPIDKLKEMSLTEEQIDYVKNPNTWENATLDTLRPDIRVALAATLNLRLETNLFSRANNHASYSIYWDWSSRPIERHTDCVASSFISSYQATNKCSSIVTYVDNNNYASPETRRYSVTSVPNKGAYVSFPMQIYTSLGPKWGKSGKAFIDIEGYNTPSGGIMTLSAYGHYKTQLTPSVSFGTGGLGFSFTPDGKTITMDQENHYIR